MGPQIMGRIQKLFPQAMTGRMPCCVLHPGPMRPNRGGPSPAAQGQRSCAAGATDRRKTSKNREGIARRVVTAAMRRTLLKKADLPLFVVLSWPPPSGISEERERVRQCRAPMTARRIVHSS
jgi:hypothetical protein